MTATEIQTQIHRVTKHAQLRGWDVDATTDGHHILTQGSTRVSIAFGTSTGLIHDAFVQILGEDGDAISRWTIVRANDQNKVAKVIEYINLA